MQPTYSSTEVIIIVETPEQKIQLGGASKHHVYRIHGSDQLNQFDVQRRYSDFIVLKEVIQARWPAIYVPALPEKKFIGNNQADFLDLRRSGLEHFLKLVSELKHIWYGETTQVEKSLKALSKTNLKEISNKFKFKFPSLQQPPKDSQQTNSLRVGEFKAYLKNAQMILEKMSKVTDLLTETRKRFYQKYENLLGNILFSYEEKCIGQYSDNKENLWFLNSKMNGVGESEEQFFKVCKNRSVSILNELIKEQLREIQNFNEILKSKDELDSKKYKLQSKQKELQIQQSKIKAGKQSLLNKIKNASKEQQLQENNKAIQKIREEFKQTQEICVLLGRILVQNGGQIGNFKKMRQINYYSIVRDLAKAQKQVYQLQEDLWSKIAGPSIGMEGTNESEQTCLISQSKEIDGNKSEIETSEKVSKQ